MYSEAKMTFSIRHLTGLAFLLCLLFSAPQAYADRLSIDAGLIHVDQPSKTYFEIGGEYEHRYNRMIGFGGTANYIFSDPSILLLALPEFFLHPLGGGWYISASPLFEFGSGTGTHVGARFGTRLPLPLGVVTLIPNFSIDFINGGTIYVIGLGIQI